MLLNLKEVTLFMDLSKYPGGVAANVTYDAYGTGPNPIFTGFTTLTNWTLYSGSIYYTIVDLPALNPLTLNGVTLDGIPRAKGRYPNTGYLSYESHSDNTSITDNSLSGSPSWVGAEVVIRKNRFILDRHFVTAHSGGTLTYDATNHFGTNVNYKPEDGNGYFIQGHLATLDIEGEWCYEPGTKRLYMHFGKTKPASRVVKASTVDNLIYSNMSSNIKFNNLDFSGGNYAFYNTGANTIDFSNCNFVQQSRDAIYGADCHHISFTGGSIVNALNDATFFETNCNYISLIGVTVSGCGMMAGMGASGDGSYSGLMMSGNGNTVSGCSIKSTGFNAIGFTGDNIKVEKNFIDSFCVVKDDGAGVYTINGQQLAFKDIIIRNNLILDGIGAFAGAESYYYEPYGKACGVYLDDNSTGITVDGNTIANGNWCGILLLSRSTYNTVKNNTVYNCLYQLAIGEGLAGGIKNNTITSNKFIAKLTSQKTLYVSIYSPDPSLLATFNNNYYARPINVDLTITVERKYANGGGAKDISFAEWKRQSNQDALSDSSQARIDNLNKIRFDYNRSAASTSVSLNPNYWKDVTGTLYNGSAPLQPYSGVVLCQSTGGQIVNGAGGLNISPTKRSDNTVLVNNTFKSIVY
jgi:parallel beta-helix repeat protein